MLARHTTIVILAGIMAAMTTACGQHARNNGSPQGIATPPPTPSGPSSFYASWASFKVGTEADYELSVLKDGIVTKIPLNYVLAETNAAEVVLTLNFPANRRVVVPANMSTAKDYTVDSLDADPKTVGAQGWPAMLYQLTYPPMVKTFSGHENVLIDGKTFDCNYGTTTVFSLTLKQWFSANVPGGLVKAEAAYDPQHLTMTLSLTGTSQHQPGT